jgi:hypothetical protein
VHWTSQVVALPHAIIVSGHARSPPQSITHGMSAGQSILPHPNIAQSNVHAPPVHVPPAAVHVASTQPPPEPSLP